MNLTSIASLHHPVVKHLSKLRQQRAYRSRCKRVVVEGKKLIHDIHRIVKVKTLITADSSLVPQGISFEEGYHVTDAIIKKITGSVTPEGIVAEVVMPEENSLESCRSIVVLDRIQDPGNVGTILRTALAFGWEGVYFVDGTCDMWNDKVIRSARGATFQLPFKSGPWSDLLSYFGRAQIVPYAADLGGISIDELKVDSKNIALVMGNEGQGLSKEASEYCQKVTIPISAKMESLNVSVAAGILMYKLRDRSYE